MKHTMKFGLFIALVGLGTNCTKDMVRSGFWLNIICIAVLVFAALFLLPHLGII